MTTKLEEAAKQDFTAEVSEWIEAFDDVVAADWEQGSELLEALRQRAREAGVPTPSELTTPYHNTIPKHDELPYPGDRAMERKVESLIRWNAMAMVHGQNKKDAGIGGHISTYSSLATLLEVGFNHFFHAKYSANGQEQPGDFVYFQGHASPGVYARAYLEGRFDDDRLKNFRHELRDTPGLSSYPHPWLMPNFWNFPTVSMGIGPLNAIYQARFMRYLENRKLIEPTERKVWAFVGDGETDEVDSLGAISVAAREKLDNLIFVVNCNLQRLDGPVRGNKRIIDELEGVFRGAGWNVIKVIWGSDWDALFERDHTGLLLRRMEECVDGEYQNFKAKGGAYLREHFFGKYPELLELVKDMSDDELGLLHRGGHDRTKIYNAYKRAVEHKGGPTVILAKTVKGHGLGSAQARNATHSEKKLADDGLAAFVKRFDIPIPEEAAKTGTPYRPAQDAPEIVYMQERRKELGGYLPAREVPKSDFKAPALDYFGEWTAGSNNRAVSTTMGFVSILRHLMKDPAIGKLIVPIVPDEGRTFGLESAIRQVGIYAPEGQKYSPHDADMLLYYREDKDGQILEEGITEAGAMASFTAAGTSYVNYKVPAIPFYMYYSMFGFQRIGDMVWAFADSRGKGFLMGGTAGRTTMLGEGLQHQDGHSIVLASTVPTCITYDPAYVYELAVVIQDGIKRMYEKGEDCFYYITMYNEDYAMPAMPEGSAEGILRGMYKLKPAGGEAVAQLFGSGPILNEVLRAQEILASKYGVHADVWSVTSYTELRRDALAVERWNRLHPAEKEKVPYVLSALGSAPGPIIATSDYMKSVPDLLSPWLPSRLVTLGTDGFGRSDNREHLRRHFEVSAEAIVGATLSKLARDGKFKAKAAQKAMAELGLDVEAADPARA
ncbi:pyruvate dehydrogenase (acetyl-transferring), homodimeric type [Tunturiibacter lichenicola]|uniref:pyruvate dehydrogenase (acetyl-transferring), homodimeric type n=1 Tax=Tunturiibacter lichenicola TaxID=2051959 RepID=UPI003D9ACB21